LHNNDNNSAHLNNEGSSGDRGMTPTLRLDDICVMEDEGGGILDRIGLGSLQILSEVNLSCKNSTNSTRILQFQTYSSLQCYITYFLLWKRCTTDTITWINSLEKHPHILLLYISRIYQQNPWPQSTLPTSPPSHGNTWQSTLPSASAKEGVTRVTAVQTRQRSL
jgi:hypothetical protein